MRVFRLKRKLAVFTILLLCLFASTSFASRCSWFVFGSSGSLDPDDHAYGTTSGQSAIGNIRGSSEISNSTYGYWYNQLTPEICLEIDIDEWALDTLSIDETRAMILGEQIEVLNCGNCNQNYGLEFVNSTPLTWLIGYSNSRDKFVLRAQFTEGLIAPSVYDPGSDYIKDVLTWAHGIEFGESGYNVSPTTIRSLWFQFLSPISSEIYGSNTITITLYCQANLP